MSGHEMSGLVENPKEGERVLAASRRPDGTLRKPVRIRAGYTPQDEVAVYQSKAAVFKQGMPVVPPGYDPEDAAAKPRTKAAKKNEKRKEKKQMVGSSSVARSSGDSTPSTDAGDGAVHQEKTAPAGSEAEARPRNDVSGVVEQMNSLTMSHPTAAVLQEDKGSSKADLEKRIRALRKKIRTAESLQTSLSSTATLTAEQKEKLSKLDTWRKELQDVESKFASR